MWKVVKCAHVENGEKQVKHQDGIAHVRYHETSHEFECLVVKELSIQTL